MSTYDEELDLLAAEYVLGSLEPVVRHSTEARLATDRKLQARVQAWQTHLHSLDENTVPEQPSAGLWDAINASIDSATPPGTTTVRADDGRWDPIAPGAQRKVLFVDVADGWETYLLRLEPGVELPGHGHTSSEECYVLEGEMIIGAAKFRAGDYHLAPAGVMHQQVSSEIGALVYVRAPLNEYLLPPTA